MTAALDDTATARIVRLDDALTRRGETVILRTGNTTVGQVSVRASVRAYGPNEIIGLISAQDREVTVSPTGLETFGAPTTSGFVVINGTPCRVISVRPFRPGGVLTRIDLQVRG